MFINDRKTDRKKKCRYRPTVRGLWGRRREPGRRVHTPGHAESLAGGNALGQNVPRRRDYCAEILAELSSIALGWSTREGDFGEVFWLSVAYSLWLIETTAGLGQRTRIGVAGVRGVWGKVTPWNSGGGRDQLRKPHVTTHQCNHR